MRKLLLTLLALCCTMATWAQNELLTAMLHHEGETTLFIGPESFIEAEEASVDGDVITLSSGDFKLLPVIKKSIAVYGAGFEEAAATGRQKTTLAGDLTITQAEAATLSDVHLEGLNISGTFKFTTPLENFVMEKCYVGSDFSIYAANNNTIVSNCVINGGVTTTGVETTNCLFEYCYIYGDVSITSSTFNHCITCGTLSTNTYTNCIFTYYQYIAQGWRSPFYHTGDATVTNCILLSTESVSSSNTFTNCYVVKSVGDIFTDETNSLNPYSAARTFELKQPETWIGTDGLEVGIRPGWSKVPRSAELKNITTTISDGSLTIDYQ